MEQNNFDYLVEGLDLNTFYSFISLQISHRHFSIV